LKRVYVLGYSYRRTLEVLVTSMV